MLSSITTKFKSVTTRAAKGRKRACNVNSPHVDGEILHVTKNNTSAHAHEYECRNGKRRHYRTRTIANVRENNTDAQMVRAAYSVIMHTSCTFTFSYIQDFAACRKTDRQTRSLYPLLRMRVRGNKVLKFWW